MIEITDLNRSFGNGKKVLNGINLHVKQGEKTAVVGSNGSGKTTLLRIVAGLTAPSAGKVWVNGFDCDSNPDKYRSLVAWAPSVDDGFFPRLSGFDNLLFFSLGRGVNKGNLIERLKSFRDIHPIAEALSTPFAICSSGMKQSLNLIRGILSGAPVVVLDEPMRSLDPDLQAEIWRIIEREFQALTILYSSHRVVKDETLNRVLNLKNGTIF